MLDNDQIAEEYEARKQQYAWVRYIGWVCGLVFVLLMADLFSGRSFVSKFANAEVALRLYLLVALLWGNLYFAFDFLTDKLCRLDLTSFASKIGIVGFNIVCLGHLFGFIRS